MPVGIGVDRLILTRVKYGETEIDFFIPNLIPTLQLLDNLVLIGLL